MRSTRSKQFIAHRGANNFAPGNTLPHLPENSLPALLEAYRVQAEYVECDVFLSSDQQIFVLHDNTLRRTARYNPALATTLTQEAFTAMLDSEVTTLSYQDQLSQVDIGAYDEVIAPIFRGTKIPLLSEFFDQLVNHPERKLVVEMKAGHTAIIGALTKLVKSYHLNVDQLIFISFDLQLITLLKAELPEFKHLLLTVCAAQSALRLSRSGLFKTSEMDYVINNEADLLKVIAVVQQAKLDGIDMQYHPSIARYLPILHQQKLLGVVWTYPGDDNLDMAMSMLEAGADFINTNQPEYIFSRLGDLEQSNAAHAISFQYKAL